VTRVRINGPGEDALGSIMTMKQHDGVVLAYVVTEPGCMRLGSGANHHIGTGIAQLSEFFDVRVIVPPPLERSPESRTTATGRGGAYWRRTSIAGALRDIKTFCTNSATAIRVTRYVHVNGITAVYLRAAFLDPLPLLLRTQGIPCFLEVNGILYKDRKRWHSSLLERAARAFEKYCYTTATHVFFVGSYGDYWKLATRNWTNIENGIEPGHIATYTRQPRSAAEPLRMVFAGTLQPHHRADILVDAVRRFADHRKGELHLVGSGLDRITEELRDVIQVVNHGVLSRNPMARLLEAMDVGLISGHPNYSSAMKLFDYGASGLAVVAPETYHFSKTFPHELAFFRPGDSVGLSDQLIRLAIDPSYRKRLASSLHSRIKDQYLWPCVFRHITDIIVHNLGAVGRDQRKGNKI
jgi:glycosyltransferase involved in cell wall biosynthesis